jgi:hypothetical protein
MKLAQDNDVFEEKHMLQFVNQRWGRLFQILWSRALETSIMKAKYCGMFCYYIELASFNSMGDRWAGKECNDIVLGGRGGRTRCGFWSSNQSWAIHAVALIVPCIWIYLYPNIFVFEFLLHDLLLQYIKCQWLSTLFFLSMSKLLVTSCHMSMNQNWNLRAKVRVSISELLQWRYGLCQ